jgi:ABC-type polysaccharide/polyol phosphate export permease
MSVWAALVGGAAGTLLLTSALSGASELRLTRIDLPFLLGTAVSPNRMRAKLIGYALHFLAGLVFALVYYAVFAAIGRAGWRLGLLFGFVHALFAGTVLVNIILPVVHPRLGTFYSAANSESFLEPPGFMLMNYGRATPVVTLLAHLVYGAVVGAFIGAAGR